MMAIMNKIPFNSFNLGHPTPPTLPRETHDQVLCVKLSFSLSEKEAGFETLFPYLHIKYNKHSLI